MLELKLSNKDSPVISLSHYGRIKCLIDTGANMAVWCRGEERFLRTFPNAKKGDLRFILSGFGKIAEIVKAYRLDELMLSSKEGQKFHYKGLYVAVSDKNSIGVDLVLPATLFRYSVLEIDRISVPGKLRIHSERNEFGFICQLYELDEMQAVQLSRLTNLPVDEIKKMQIIDKAICLAQDEGENI